MKIRGILLLSFACSACINHPENKPTYRQKNLKEPLINANKVITSDNTREIERYIERHQLAMAETGSGLRYFIVKKGSGEKVVSGNRLQIKYRSSLLNEMICYEGEKELTAGHGDIESGVEEGILLLHEGDSAMFIIPPHLGYGITGDNKRIPSSAVLVYYLIVKRVAR